VEISYTHRFIFIHVYRVAGESVSQALRPYSHVPRRRPVIDRIPIVRRIGFPTDRKVLEHRYGHMKAKDVRAALPELFDECFKFAFVRNPWDWQVSVYHYVSQRTDHPDHAQFSRFRDFDDYLDWRINGEGPELQSEFVLDDDGELIVDFVGHFESLAEDFGTVCERVGIPAALPHINRSRHRDYREHYSPAARALVSEAYARDIEFFGYDFDEPRRLTPLVRPAARATSE
jgi:hypothetical protein